MSAKKVLFGLVLLSMLCLISACGQDGPSFKTEYQAVFMDNGQVFFGKLEKTDSPYPVLKDVYYIGRQTSPDGKQAANVLVKRGNEWHSPEYMNINKQHIVIIEPVSSTSRVAQLIKEAKVQQPLQATQPPEGTGK